MSYRVRFLAQILPTTYDVGDVNKIFHLCEHGLLPLWNGDNTHLPVSCEHWRSQWEEKHRAPPQHSMLVILI